MTKEAHQQMLNAAINKVAKELAAKAPVPTAQQEAIKRSANVCMKVRREYLGRLRLMPMRPSKEEAFTMLADMLRDGFKDFTHDELLYVNSLSHATVLIDALHNELA